MADQGFKQHERCQVFIGLVTQDAVDGQVIRLPSAIIRVPIGHQWQCRQ